MEIHALRLSPEDDLKLALDGFARENRLEAVCVRTCVGSLRKAVLRYANREEATTLDGKFEIVSLTDVFSLHGSHHHISISDGEGRTYGARLLDGCEVYTTAEIVLASFPGMQFLRSFDPLTGYPELDIRHDSKSE